MQHPYMHPLCSATNTIPFAICNQKKWIFVLHESVLGDVTLEVGVLGIEVNNLVEIRTVKDATRGVIARDLIAHASEAKPKDCLQLRECREERRHIP